MESEVPDVKDDSKPTNKDKAQHKLYVEDFEFRKKLENAA